MVWAVLGVAEVVLAVESAEVVDSVNKKFKVRFEVRFELAVACSASREAR